jgi:hypothetical protein
MAQRNPKGGDKPTDERSDLLALADAVGQNIDEVKKMSDAQITELRERVARLENPPKLGDLQKRLAERIRTHWMPPATETKQ